MFADWGIIFPRKFPGAHPVPSQTCRGKTAPAAAHATDAPPFLQPAVAWALARTQPDLLSHLVILCSPHPQTYLANMDLKQFQKSWYVFLFQVSLGGGPWLGRWGLGVGAALRWAGGLGDAVGPLSSFPPPCAAPLNPGAATTETGPPSQLPWLPEALLSDQNFEFINRMFTSKAMGLKHRENMGPDALARYKTAIMRPGSLTSTINYYRALYRYDPDLPRCMRRPDLVLGGLRGGEGSRGAGSK